MALGDIVADHERSTRTLTVHAPEPVDGLADYFAAPGVEVRHEPLPDDGRGGFVAVTEGEEFLGSVPAADLRALVAPEEIPEPDEAREEALKTLFVLLRDATFSTLDRRQLLAAAREFEDRAVRTGSGGLHAGFQRPAALRAQADLYRRLADGSGLDVHVYLDGEWSSPELPGVTVHAEADSELGEYWFVLFDGGPDARSACGLVAEEREAGAYYGFWTYDATTVNRMLTYLQDSY